VDNTKEFTHLGLCAGYGGIELGLHRVIRTLRTVALCEIEAFACANLVAKMEAGLMDCAPIWTDLKTFPWAEFRDRVDILTGGYPCQPFSAAGKRLGTEDPRHLWPFIASGIRILRPKLCFFENVEGHISLGLREVIGELGAIGYQTAWGIFSASVDAGAPHQRKRVFILAYDSSAGLQGREWGWKAGTQGEPSGHLAQCGGAMAVSNSLGGAAGLSRSLAWNERIAGESNHGSYEVVANAGRLEPQGWCGAADGQQSGAGRIPRGEPAPRHDQVWPSRPGEQQFAWEPPRVVANNHRPHAGHGEQRPERTHRDLSGGCGEAAGEAMGNATQRQDHGREPGDLGLAPSQGRCGDDAADGTGEGVGNADHGRLASGVNAGSGEEADRGGQGDIEQADGGAMGNPNSPRPQERPWQRGEGIQGTHADGGADADGQAQPSVGRDTHGATGGLGYAELCVSCDNRTDELRLLGNGVVPATAERAFLTLMQELLKGTN